MRRARIKALATVPIRRKVQNTVASADSNDVSDKEHVQENISNIVISDISIEQEANKDITKVQEKVNEDKKNETNSVDTEVITVEKSNFQELYTQVKDKPELVGDKSPQKNIPSVETSTIIDIVSPTKITQSRSCFMRPTPRLDSSGRVRKNSIQGSGASASESEDEHSKKAVPITPNRIRNDSVCSIQSNKESTINDNQINFPRIKTTQKRRMLVSESARKLAEARREFLLKHENKTPDRSQLKMYDLIYYNPVTNPMKKSETSTVVSRQINIPQSDVMPEEEDEDDPSAMPVPQVKIGPNGQLMIDEQSLVIEQTSIKKNKEILAQEVIIEDDTHCGGFYKKRQKSKEWPKWETFKFYRALNVVGTDFLLMQSLFPNRTRQQIKQKYKKEERVNRHLVEKALKYHQEFDPELLKEQLAMLQNLENIQTNTNKKSFEKGKNVQRQTKDRKRKHRFVATSIAECETSSIDDKEAEDTDIDDRRRNSDGSCMNNSGSDSDTEVYQIRPTRSGRQPKAKRLQGPDINTLDNSIEKKLLVSDDNAILSSESSKVTKDTHMSLKTNQDEQTAHSEGITTVISDINKIEPGSLVILSKESTEEPGNTILQVYMVSSNMDNVQSTTKSDVTTGNLSPKFQSTETTNLEDI